MLSKIGAVLASATLAVGVLFLGLLRRRYRFDAQGESPDRLETRTYCS